MSSTSDLLLGFQHELLRVSRDVDPSRFKVTSVFSVEMTFQPNSNDLPYSDYILVVQASETGCCCCFSKKPDIDADIIGSDLRYVRPRDLFYWIALLDAGFGQLVLDCKCDRQVWRGSASEKAILRATLISSEVKSIIEEFPPRGSNAVVAVVGAVGSIISELVANRHTVVATDLDSSIIGKELAGVPIQDGYKHTFSNCASADVAVVTGSALASETISDVLDVCRRSSVPVLMYCQTGAHFGPSYLDMGVATVIGEEFPFYMLPGDTHVVVYRNRG